MSNWFFGWPSKIFYGHCKLQTMQDFAKLSKKKCKTNEHLLRI
jgi:hypothetical protein